MISLLFLWKFLWTNVNPLDPPLEEQNTTQPTDTTTTSITDDVAVNLSSLPLEIKSKGIPKERFIKELYSLPDSQMSGSTIPPTDPATLKLTEAFITQYLAELFPKSNWIPANFSTEENEFWTIRWLTTTEREEREKGIPEFPIDLGSRLLGELHEERVNRSSTELQKLWIMKKDGSEVYNSGNVTGDFDSIRYIGDSSSFSSSFSGDNEQGSGKGKRGRRGSASNLNSNKRKRSSGSFSMNSEDEDLDTRSGTSTPTDLTEKNKPLKKRRGSATNISGISSYEGNVSPQGSGQGTAGWYIPPNAEDQQKNNNGKPKRQPSSPSVMKWTGKREEDDQDYEEEVEGEGSTTTTTTTTSSSSSTVGGGLVEDQDAPWRVALNKLWANHLAMMREIMELAKHEGTSKRDVMMLKQDIRSLKVELLKVRNEKQKGMEFAVPHKFLDVNNEGMGLLNEGSSSPFAPSSPSGSSQETGTQKRKRKRSNSRGSEREISQEDQFEVEEQRGTILALHPDSLPGGTSSLSQ